MTLERSRRLINGVWQYVTAPDGGGGPSGPVTAADIDSTPGGAGEVLTADGAGAASWEPSGGSVPVTKTVVDYGDIIVSGETAEATITITGGTPSSGDFALNVDGSSIGTLNWNATVSDVQNLLDAEFGPGGGTASGTALPAGTITVLMDGNADNPFAFTVTDNTLNAGTPTITTIHPGAYLAGRALLATLDVDDVLVSGSLLVTEVFDDSDVSPSPTDARIATYNVVTLVSEVDADLTILSTGGKRGEGLGGAQGATVTMFAPVDGDPVDLYFFVNPWAGDGSQGSLTAYLDIRPAA